MADINPTGIATAEAWGSPTLSGEVDLSDFGIASAEAWGSPTLFPAGGTVLYIDFAARGGVNSFREESPFQISKTLSAAWSATFDLRWFGGTLPTCGQDVALFWLGTKFFGGVILSVTETSIKKNFSESILTIRCTGYQSYLDRTIVAKLYTLAMGGVAPIVIFDLWYEHLAQFGVTINYPQGNGSVLIGEPLYHYITVMEAANRLKEQQPGYDHVVTDDKEWQWFLAPNAAAPFTLRNNDNNVDTMSNTRSNARFRNSQWVLPAVDLMALREDTETATAAQVNFESQYALNSTPIVTRDTGSGPVAEAVTSLGVWDGSPWYYIPGGIGVFRTPGASAVGAGDIVVIAYPNPFPLGFNVRDEASITAVGLYEAVHQAKDAVTEAECLQIAAGLLELYGDGGFQQKLVFTYNSQNQSAWLSPGMSLDVDRTFPKALGTYTVEQVVSTLEKLTVWRHTVTCRSGLGEVTDRQALEAYRTSGRLWVNVPPIRVTIELDLTGAGNVVGVQDQFYTMMGQGFFASWDMQFESGFEPTGEDFIMDITMDGVSIFPSGNANKMVVPMGSTAQAGGFLFVSSQLAYADAQKLKMNIIQAAGTSYGVGHLNLKPNTALPPV